jgi:shikimate 5-dehydrogenase
MDSPYPIVKKSVPTFYFIGVTTTKSSIMKVFPMWMKELGRPEIVIEGKDLKIHDDPERYREAVAQIKYDPNSLGALVTTHKMDLYAAAKDMFEYLDPYAEICSEMSSISKQDGRLEGHAKDPITAGLSLDAIIEPGYFGCTGGEVLLFGAGGSSIATVLHLMNKEDTADRPHRIIVINRSQGRLDHMHAMVEKLGTDMQIEYICSSDAQRNDEVMGSMPEYSIVINATGMGKDVPGSPITDAGLFPMNSIAWEFNYRGELDFMHQAEAQAQSRNVRVEDGWVYFLHGWTQVIAQVLHMDLTGEVFDRLAKVAETVRK